MNTGHIIIILKLIITHNHQKVKKKKERNEIRVRRKTGMQELRPHNMIYLLQNSEKIKIERENIQVYLNILNLVP